MIGDIKKDAEARMQKSVESFQNELSKVRTGRAHASLLDHVQVEYYGSMVPLSQCANVTNEDARTLTVAPWEKDMVGKVEKAIMTSDLGLNPNTSGLTIRIILPALTEERRRQLVKVVKHEGENARVAIRNIRRDANQDLKDLEKEKMISEDDLRRGEQEIQRLTDQFVGRVDEILADKEQEMMAV